LTTLVNSFSLFLQQLFTPEKKASIGNNPVLLEFLEFVLLRDPARRPKYARSFSSLLSPLLRFPSAVCTLEQILTDGSYPLLP
jgi:hypothetical protein